MKPDVDPPRLLDSASPEASALRAALRGARDDMPSPEQLGRLAARLPLRPGSAPSIGPSPATEARGASAPQPSPAAAGLTAPTLFGAGAGLVLLAAVALFATTRVSSPARIAEPTSGAEAEIQPVSAAPPSSAAPGDRAIEARGPGDPPSAEAPLPAASAVASPLPPRAPSALPPPASAAPSAAGEAESEISLLRRAQEALGASPARALALAEEHQSHFRGGALAQERELIAITALVRLGRTGEARARAARFFSSYPRSVHRPRIEALLPGMEPGAPSP